ncbi:hypothetical protein [Paenibacillus donghaensis]|uniref:CopG family transcriptional regulator n=1 Tax=Paenibacillus donghaensis TaxID=414771 RepID=A0A2Z2KAK4_9BACL|nr:hypothetical protein [Paenibacillus donghaensis]ASA22507.1 hypothetical protein B9T62_17990 [Paenibacillus donghaensis]
MPLKEKPPRLTVYLPDTEKKELEKMSKNTGFSQTQLVVMATHSLLANYKAKGNIIFTELIGLNLNEKSSQNES